MGFKDHTDTLTIKHNGEKREVNLIEYKEFLKKCQGLNRDLKEVIHQIHIKGQVPFMLGESFVMVNISNGKTEQIKTRKQKELCGVIINALVRSSSTHDQFDSIKEAVKWDVPDLVLSGFSIED